MGTSVCEHVQVCVCMHACVCVGGGGGGGGGGGHQTDNQLTVKQVRNKKFNFHHKYDK